MREYFGQANTEIDTWSEGGIWPGCYDTVSGFFWVFCILYFVISVGIRSFFVRMLYWWYKEGTMDKDQDYQSLNGDMSN